MINRNYIGGKRLGVVISSKERFPRITIDNTIDFLYENLPIKNWILTGGLAIDLIYGRQIRPRADIDIRVPIDELLESVNTSTGMGEYVFAVEHARGPFLFYADLMEFPKKINLKKIRGKHMKFISKRYLSGEKREILDLIDLYSSVDGKEIKYGFDLRDVEKDRFQYATPHGNIIEVSGQRYMMRIKELMNRRKDKQELKMLKAI